MWQLLPVLEESMSIAWLSLVGHGVDDYFNRWSFFLFYLLNGEIGGDCNDQCYLW
jgi:hypothetical protein